MRILGIRYSVCWLFISGNGEEGGCVVGGRGGQMLWEIEVFEDLNLTRLRFKILG